jgi:predicted transcriptional regulator
MSLLSDSEAVLGRELRSWVKGRTQADAARILGVSRPALCAWLSGSRIFSVARLMVLWEATGGVGQLSLGREEDSSYR